MELVAKLTYHSYQHQLHKVMYIFRFPRFKERWIMLHLLADFLEGGGDAIGFLSSKHTCADQRMSMRCAGRQLFPDQHVIERKGALPLLESRIERLSQPPGPHLHEKISCLSLACERAGSPRMRMKPPASF